MELNCISITTPQALHEALAEALHFPQWYGHNLDALYDCLTDLETPTFLTLMNFPSWAETFLEVFQEAAEENDLLHITIQ